MNCVRGLYMGYCKFFCNMYIQVYLTDKTSFFPVAIIYRPGIHTFNLLTFFIEQLSLLPE